jgi:hypothetical protein
MIQAPTATIVSSIIVAADYDDRKSRSFFEGSFAFILPVFL